MKKKRELKEFQMGARSVCRLGTSLNEKQGCVAVRLKVDLGTWEEDTFDWACSSAQEAAKSLLESIDKELMKEKQPGLEAECLKGHRTITAFGNVRVKLRLYRNGTGNCQSLLDEKMGLDRGCQVSPKAKELATFVSSHLLFHSSE